MVCKMRGFPKVGWVYDENKYSMRMIRGGYSHKDNVILLLTPNINTFWAWLYVLSHETIHWFLAYFIPDIIWDKVNLKFDLLCEWFENLRKFGKSYIKFPI